jgi:solute carrier family 50 protein (sugar transporter)
MNNSTITTPNPIFNNNNPPSQQTIDLIGIFCAIFTLLMWSSPIRDIFIHKTSICKIKSTDHVTTGLPYVSSLMNSVVWFSFTVTRPTLIVATCVNGMGIVLNSIFCCMYGWYSVGLKQREFFKECAVVIIIPTIIEIITVFVTGTSESIAWVAAGVNILMYASPLAAVFRVCRDKTVIGYPFLPIFFGFGAAICWFIYGIYTFVIPIMIPNGLGILLGLIELIIYWVVYCCSSGNNNSTDYKSKQHQQQQQQQGHHADDQTSQESSVDHHTNVTNTSHIINNNGVIII